MADLPSATSQQTETGGGIGLDDDLLCVISCTTAGTAAQFARYRKHGDITSTFAEGEGVDFTSHYIRRTNKSVLFGKVVSAVAGSISPVDTSRVTGTSIVTYTGTPNEEEDIRFEVITGGTIGTAGIIARFSRDRGRTFSSSIRLGTATSYAIPGTGVTINFAAGTLIAGDYSTAHCNPAMWDATGLAAVFTALAAGTALPGLILLCGDIPDRNTLDLVTAQISAYETAIGRDARVMINVRDQYPQAVKQGVATVGTASAGKTYTRSIGSYITDGLKVGMTAVWSGFVNAASNGPKTITVLTATVMTVQESIGADEAAVAGTICVANELKPAWRLAVSTIIGSTPPTEAKSQRTFFCGGRGRRISPYNFTYKRRPAAWWLAMRSMEHDIKVSPAKVGDGALDGVTIFDQNEQLEDHDERTDGGLLAMRMTCMRTFDRPAGVYIALPLTLDTDNAPLSRGPVGRVADLISTIVKQAGTLQLNGEFETKNDGTIKEFEARRIEGSIQSELNSKAKGREGVRWSQVTVTMDRSRNVTVPGTKVPFRTRYRPLGYLEFVDNVIEVVVGG